MEPKYNGSDGGEDLVDLNIAMRELASKRPVFHSEADFQHALALTIAAMEPDANIRLEYRPLSDERVYLDMWIADGDRKLAVELKYKTRMVSIDWQGERYDLANQGAQDLGAYDVWKDVQRIEGVCTRGDGVEGYVICLSNDPVYWRQPKENVTVGSAFRLNEGRTATGGLYWASHAGDGTMKNREKPIVLSGSYRIAWHDFSRLGPGTGLTFRYAVIPVQMAASAPTTNATEAAQDRTPQPSPRPAAGTRSKYGPLSHYLAGTHSGSVSLTYSQINEILGWPLPQSAYDHPAQFWANTYTHSYARSWLDVGWRVTGNSITGERVTFQRVPSSEKR